MKIFLSLLILVLVTGITVASSRDKGFETIKKLSLCF